MTITVPNGNFSNGETGGCPNDWDCTTGDPDSSGSTAYWTVAQLTGGSGTNWAVRSTDYIDVSYLTLSNKLYSTVTLEYCAASRNTVWGPYAKIFLYEYDGSANLVATNTATFGVGDTTSTFHCSDGFAPDLVFAPMDPDTQQLKIGITGYGNYGAWTNIGPITIDVATGTVGGTSGGGGGGGTVDLSTLFDVDSGTIGTVTSNAAAYITQACGSLSSISSVAGLAPDAWGGAGFGGQVASILQGIRDLCEQEAQTEVLGDIAGGILLPDVVTGTTPPGTVIVPTAGTPPADTLPEYESAIAIHEGNSDDLVTAANRANEIFIASTKYQIAELQKLRDAQEVQYAYQTPRGARISATDIAANEPNMEFAEGDYAQTFDRVNELIDDAEVSPDFFRRSENNDGATVLADAGGCLLDTPAPTGEGWSYQFERMRWNIRQQLMTTDAGQLLCEITEPEVTAGPLCLESTIAGLADVGLLDGMMPTSICVEGPTAIDPVPLLFSMLSFLILMGGILAAIGEFV